MAWQDWLENKKPHEAVPENFQRDFWKETLGELLLDEQEATYTKMENAAYQVSAPTTSSSGNVTERKLANTFGAPEDTADFYKNAYMQHYQRIHNKENVTYPA